MYVFNSLSALLLASHASADKKWSKDHTQPLNPKDSSCASSWQPLVTECLAASSQSSKRSRCIKGPQKYDIGNYLPNPFPCGLVMEDKSLEEETAISRLVHLHEGILWLMTGVWQEAVICSIFVLLKFKCKPIYCWLGVCCFIFILISSFLQFSVFPLVSLIDFNDISIRF